MGTSASSRGPGSGVPLVPPWVSPVEPTQPPTEPDGPPSGDGPGVPEGPLLSPPQPASPPVLAPQGRFRGTRICLGRFGSGGRGSDLKKGLSRYVKHGLGGAATGAHRMSGTARTAGLLHSVLSSLGSGQALPVSLGVDPRSLVGRPAREVGDVIIDGVRPTDGTQDTEAARSAMYEAQADLLQQFPQADLAALNAEQIDLVTERYVAHDLCFRIDLDVGKSIMVHAPDAATAMRRLEEVRQYVMQTVAACFRKQRSTLTWLNQRSVTVLAQSVLRAALDVFEEYIR